MTDHLDPRAEPDIHPANAAPRQSPPTDDDAREHAGPRTNRDVTTGPDGATATSGRPTHDADELDDTGDATTGPDGATATGGLSNKP